MSVTIHTTIGDVKIEVFCDTAPRTAFNFLALCASGYYDGTAFHRNMKGFMIQGGDPNGTGKGGESIWGGKFNDEFHADNKHDVRGQVSMANTGINTNGSQFFITYERQPHLNNVYTVFGRVLDGWDTLDQMERLPVEGEAAAKKRNKFRPIKPPLIKGVTIHANPLADSNIIYPTKDGEPLK
uniref:Peptidyl-prolyl cis-trans isomerase n=1 Tax=Skeletonema marinoi TaxID=267567 RepID=A0A7S2LRT9_9STRA